jgi:hypothetical protein
MSSETTRRYKFRTFDFEVDVELDTAKLSLEDAGHIANFWSGHRELIAKCKGGCLYEAVARLAAARGLYYSQAEDYVLAVLPKEIQKDEGWPEEDFGLKFHNIQFAERPSADEWELYDD